MNEENNCTENAHGLNTREIEGNEVNCKRNPRTWICPAFQEKVLDGGWNMKGLKLTK